MPFHQLLAKVAPLRSLHREHLTGLGDDSTIGGEIVYR